MEPHRHAAAWAWHPALYLGDTESVGHGARSPRCPEPGSLWPGLTWVRGEPCCRSSRPRPVLGGSFPPQQVALWGCSQARREGGHSSPGAAPGGSEVHSGAVTGVEVTGPVVAPQEEPGPACCIPAIPSRHAFCREESDPSCVHTPGPALPPSPSPQDEAETRLHSGLMRTDPEVTLDGGGQPRGGSPAAGHAGRGEPTPSEGWRGDRGRPPPPAPRAAPSRFQQLVLVSQIQLSPTSTRSSAESPGDVTETLGDVLGRKPGRDGRSATAGLRPEKGSTTLPQSDRGLTRGAPRAEAKPCSMQL